MRTNMSIIPARSEHLDEIHKLFREYEAFLNVDLCFQGFEEELASLPGKYAPPFGALFIAFVDDGVAGCVGLRPIEGTTCEMKRLFVRPNCRGLGLGRDLACRVIEESMHLGYKRMRLDTLKFLKSAIQLYTSLGFREIESYYSNPLDGVMYWELELDRFTPIKSHCEGT